MLVVEWTQIFTRYVQISNYSLICIHAFPSVTNYILEENSGDTTVVKCTLGTNHQTALMQTLMSVINFKLNHIKLRFCEGHRI